MSSSPASIHADIGLQEHTPTSVMSPNTGTDLALAVPTGMLPRWGAHMASYTCDVCAGDVYQVIVCAFCQTAGHEQCVRPTYLEGYAFCQACTPTARAQWDRAQLAHQQERWTARVAQQISGWRSAAAATTGALGSAGVAIGGVSAIMLGGTAALVRGAVQGALASHQSTRTQPVIEDITEVARPVDGGASAVPRDTGRDTGRRRSSSLGAVQRPRSLDAIGDAISHRGVRELAGVPAPPLGPQQHLASISSTISRSRTNRQMEAEGHCVACHTENRSHRPHIHIGDCIHIPQREFREWGHCSACHDDLQGHRVHIRMGQLPSC